MDIKLILSGLCSLLLNVVAIGSLINPAIAEPVKAFLVGLPIVGVWIVGVSATLILQVLSFAVTWLVVGGVMSILGGVWPLIVTALVVILVMLVLTGTLTQLIGTFALVT